MAKKSNTAATATAQKEPTKMELAKGLYGRVTAKAAPEGSSHRGIFIEMAMQEIGLSKAGANTYFQNLKSEAAGEGRYPYSPASRATAENQTQPTRRPGRPSTRSKVDVKSELDALSTMATELNKRINTIAKQVA